MIDIKSSARLYNETKGELDYAINDVYTSGTVMDGKYCQLVEEKLKINRKKICKISFKWYSITYGIITC